MAAVLGNFLTSLKYFGGQPDDDPVDHWHYVVTSNVLIALSLLISFKQFGGKPIECLIPDMFSSAWEQVGNSSDDL